MSDRIDEVIMLLGEIKSDVKHCVKSIADHTLDDKEQFGAIDKQIGRINSKLTFRSGFQAGMTGVIGAASGGIISLLALWMKGH